MTARYQVKNLANTATQTAQTALLGTYAALGQTGNTPTPIVEGDLNNFNHDYGEDGARTYWYHPDHLGSSSYITNVEGIVTQHMEYMPYGESLVEEHQNSINTPYKFNGKEQDDETGNYYYGARYYNPKFGFWLSVDPLAEKYPGWSSYNYVMNNPINLIDPDGRVVSEPPKDGIPQFMDDTGTYFWNEGKGCYEHYADPNGSGYNSFQGYYYVDENSKAVGNSTFIYNGKDGIHGGYTEYHTSTLHKVIKTGVNGFNASAGSSEIIAGVGALFIPEPTVSKAAAAYGLADGTVRVLGSITSTYGAWTENERLENAPSNLLGLVGFGLDNLISNDNSISTGGTLQTIGELSGDFGLSKKTLINSLEKHATKSSLRNIINIVNSVLFIPKTVFGERVNRID